MRAAEEAKQPAKDQAGRKANFAKEQAIAEALKARRTRESERQKRGLL